MLKSESVNKKMKTKGVGVMAGGYMPDGELLPDRYYARLQHGHLGIYETLQEAIEARRGYADEDKGMARQWVDAYKDP